MMEEPIEVLEDFIKSNPDVRELKRALAVKYVKLNKTYREIMELLNVSIGFIHKWVHLYDLEGTKGLRLRYQGSKGYLSPAETGEVLEWLQEKSQYSLQELQQHVQTKYGVVYQSAQSYYTLFKQGRIHWKKAQASNPKRDPQQVSEKQTEIKKSNNLVGRNGNG